ncbi:MULTISPECIES: hypothetical protein [Legionella]|uniref:SHOCT domain-containing protein n=2 Tax=Legionella TaxID=445 RepID=D3HTK2_LEGLN|nr:MULTISPECIES: hypothetical protein [Legionella]AUH72814.1 hypothetical protein CAB17_12785 [Legionella sainthelensi]CBJ12244.1 hypothetical protein LLO_1866 [Legionella longbeachae NSW150]
MAKIFWGISFLSTLGAILYYNLFTPNSAPQQAALAAMTLVIAILPYCLARAVAEAEKIAEVKEKTELHKEINSTFLDYFILNRISLLFTLTNVEHLSTPTYEQIINRVNYLKKLLDEDLISNDEYEQARNYLLVTLKDNLKQQIER